MYGGGGYDVDLALQQCLQVRDESGVIEEAPTPL
jgi:hypothetical protein